MNFRLRSVSKRKEIETKGKCETRKVLMKSKTSKRMGSPMESPIYGEVKL